MCCSARGSRDERRRPAPRPHPSPVEQAAALLLADDGVREVGPLPDRISISEGISSPARTRPERRLAATSYIASNSLTATGSWDRAGRTPPRDQRREVVEPSKTLAPEPDRGSYVDEQNMPVPPESVSTGRLRRLPPLIVPTRSSRSRARIAGRPRAGCVHGTSGGTCSRASE